MVNCGMMNCGYEIIVKKGVEEGVVIGHDHKAVMPFVTWRFNYLRGDTPNFFWGHYFKECSDALNDFNKRL